MDQQIKEYQTYFNELKLKYDPNNVQDQKQLIFILDELDYPSTERALLHMQSNRLGKLDLKDKQKKRKSKNKNDSKQENKIEQKKQEPVLVSTSRLCQPHIKQKQQIKKARHCACCGLMRQKQKLSLFTHFSEIQHLGVATRLFFIAYLHVLILMLSLFLIYTLYAIISNVLACGCNENNLQEEYQNDSYKELIKQWIFATSLHANLACMKDKSFTYEVQCWLGVILMIIYYVIIAALRFRKILICSRLQQKSKSIADLSILINNLPIAMDKAELQSQLKAYQESISNRETEQQKRQIKIVKINRAAPYYLSLSTFKGKQIEEVEKEFDDSRDKIVNLIKDRRNNFKFVQNQKQRKDIYKAFSEAKRERIQTYKRIALANILKKNQSQIITSPAFVTFQSSHNRDFLLDTYKSSKNIFSSKKKFEFNVFSKNKKLIKTIKSNMEAAPRPEEVIWTNLGQSKSKLLKKKLFIGAINILFLIISFAVTFGLQLYDFNYAMQSDGDPSSLGITILVTFVIVIISYVIQYVLTVLTAKQRNITVMHEQKSLQHKYVQSCIANYLIAPLIFSLVYKPQFEGIAPLSTTVFILSIDNAFFFPLLGLLDPLYFFNRFCKWYYCRPLKKLQQNQRQLNANCQYMQFPVGQQFAYAINSFIFTCFYAPLQPIIVVFSIVGIFLMYWIQKYILFNRCYRPVPGNRIINISTHIYLTFGPITFGIGCLVWPYYIKHQFIGIGPAIIIIILSIILFLTPFDRISDKVLKFLEDRGFSMGEYETKQKIYSHMKKKFKYDYQRLNYMTAKQAMKRFVYESFFKGVSMGGTVVSQGVEIDRQSVSKSSITQRTQLSQEQKYKNITNVAVSFNFLNKNKTRIAVNNYNRLKSLSSMNKNIQDSSSQKIKSVHGVERRPELEHEPEQQAKYFSSHSLGPANVFLKQTYSFGKNKCIDQCKQEKDNYDFYYKYNDDEQILIHQVLEHLKQKFMNKASIIDDNYTDVDEAYEISGKCEQGSAQYTW